MKKILKNICACLVMLVLFAGAFTLVGCGKDDEEKLMTIAMNPSLEFVLDEDDKVVSVTATNDDGNYILTKVNFEGKTAKEAINEFLRVAKENGFVVSGSVDTSANQLTISISGDHAQKLFNQVKKSATEYLSELNINAIINFGEVISKEDLKARVQEVMQELTSTQLANMSEEDLVELLEESHKETEELLSQELKDLYYKTRAEEVVKAKFEAIKQILSSNLGLFQTYLESLTESLTNLTSNITEYKDTFVAQMLSGTYAQEMQDYMAAKKALLEEQLKTTLDANVIAELKVAVDSAEESLETAKANAELLMVEANNAINTAVAQMNTALDTILSVMQNFMKTNAETIENAIENIKENYKTTFETEFASYITQAEELWENMNPQELAA